MDFRWDVEFSRIYKNRKLISTSHTGPVPAFLVCFISQTFDFPSDKATNVGFVWSGRQKVNKVKCTGQCIYTNWDPLKILSDFSWSLHYKLFILIIICSGGPVSIVTNNEIGMRRHLESINPSQSVMLLMVMKNSEFMHLEWFEIWSNLSVVPFCGTAKRNGCIKYSNRRLQFPDKQFMSAEKLIA